MPEVISILLILALLFLAVMFGVYFLLLARHGVEEVAEEYERGGKELPYRLKRYFFTKSEREFYRLLNERLAGTSYRIFPKVRTGDFLVPNGEGKEWWSKWGRIKSRHIDFLVWNMDKKHFAAAIEVDGNSHRSPKNQEVDAFKDDIFESIGLKLIRVRVGSDFAAEINEITKKLKN